MRLARTLAETGALFFGEGLVLKDGRPTPYFVNSAMFRTGRLSLEFGSFFADMMVSRNLVSETDVLLGPSYKGSAIAQAAAIALWKDHGIELPFDYDRKEAKTHGEAASRKSVFVNGALFDGCRILVLDDVATSMGTKYELLEKIDAEARERGARYHVVGIGIGIDREQTTAVYDKEGRVVLGEKGRDAIEEFVNQTGIAVYSVAGVREIVSYLYGERIPVTISGEKALIDDRVKARFDEYLELYGVSPGSGDRDVEP